MKKPKESTPQRLLSTVGSLTIALCLLGLWFCLQTVSAAEQSIEKLLPAKQCAKGWAIEDGIKLFDKETLFDHIDGEAELYFPYGFEALAAAVYVSRRDPNEAVAADVYRMGSLLDAFGIYSNYRRTDAEPVAIGTGGFISPTQLMFYQGRFFVRLQASAAGGLDRKILTACARAISEKIALKPGPPREIAWLSIPGTVPRSERYIAKSPLGYAFFSRGLTADVQSGGERIQILIVPEPSTKAAQESMDRYRAYLEQSGGRNVKSESAPDRASLTATDPLYGNILLDRSGRFLIGAVRLKDLKAAKRILNELRRNLPIP